MTIPALPFDTAAESARCSTRVGDHVAPDHTPRKLVVRVLRKTTEHFERGRFVRKPRQNSLEIARYMTRRSTGRVIQDLYDVQQLASRVVADRQRLTFTSQGATVRTSTIHRHSNNNSRQR